MENKFFVSYTDGFNKRKSAVVRTKFKDVDDYVLLQAVLEKYGDEYAEDYNVEAIVEEEEIIKCN